MTVAGLVQDGEPLVLPGVSEEATRYAEWKIVGGADAAFGPSALVSKCKEELRAYYVTVLRAYLDRPSARVILVSTPDGCTFYDVGIPNVDDNALGALAEGFSGTNG